MSENQTAKSSQRIKNVATALHDSWHKVKEIMTDADEANCRVCGLVILVGGCPSKHPDCPGFDFHKKEQS